MVDDETWCVKGKHLQIYILRRRQQLTVSFEASPGDLLLGREKNAKRRVLSLHPQDEDDTTFFLFVQ